MSRADLPDRVWEGGFWNIFLPPRGGKLFQDVSGLPYGRETEPSGALDDLEWVAVLGRHPGIGVPRGGSNQIAPSQENKALVESLITIPTKQHQRCHKAVGRSQRGGRQWGLGTRGGGGCGGVSGQWGFWGSRAVERDRLGPLANRREPRLWKARLTSEETFKRSRNQEDDSSQNP